jgi:hypothetical protein
VAELPLGPVAAACGIGLHRLARLRAEELDDAGRAEVEAHAAGCPRCRTVLDRMAEEEAAWAKRADPAAASVAILARLERAPITGQTRHPRLAVAGFGALATLLLVVATVSGPAIRPGSPGPGRETRIKGERIALQMFVDTPNGARRHDSASALTAGDRVQFRYQAGGHRHLLLVSVDGRAISPLYPPEPGPSIEVEPEGLRILPGSIILDDVVGPERVFAFFSDRPLEFRAVEPDVRRALSAKGGDIEALDHIEGLASEPEVEQRSVLLHKQ